MPKGLTLTSQMIWLTEKGLSAEIQWKVMFDFFVNLKVVWDCVMIPAIGGQTGAITDPNIAKPFLVYSVES